MPDLTDLLILLALNLLLWAPLLLLKRPIFIVTERLPRLRNDFPAGVSWLFLVFVRKGFDSAELRRHEEVHFRQWRRYSPMIMGALYLASSLYWLIRTRSLWGAYWHNRFEVEARKAS
ncbi:MAG TPA: hypothetical protein P5077_11890 [bacterium]|nr:hypothetical protein [bacterium]